MPQTCITPASRELGILVLRAEVRRCVMPPAFICLSGVNDRLFICCLQILLTKPPYSTAYIPNSLSNVLQTRQCSHDTGPNSGTGQNANSSCTNHVSTSFFPKCCLNGTDKRHKLPGVSFLSIFSKAHVKHVNSSSSDTRNGTLETNIKVSGMVVHFLSKCLQEDI